MQVSKGLSIGTWTQAALHVKQNTFQHTKSLFLSLIIISSIFYGKQKNFSFCITHEYISCKKTDFSRHATSCHFLYLCKFRSEIYDLLHVIIVQIIRMIWKIMSISGLSSCSSIKNLCSVTGTCAVTNTTLYLSLWSSKNKIAQLLNILQIY